MTIRCRSAATEAGKSGTLACKAVGDDAHIVPADSTVFTEIFGESGGALGSMWASTPTNIPEDFKRTVGASAPTSVGEESEKWKSVREDLTDFFYLPK